MAFEAILYDKEADGSTRCRLCAHYCTVRDGKRGLCRVRENRGGTLYSLVYGKLVAANADPIEKKPLYHFQPGTRSYSIATAGCNMTCTHCQNYQISLQAARTPAIPGTDVRPEDVVAEAVKLGCHSIAYTYTEPTIFMEFARDCALRAREEGLANVFVTNGFMSEDAAELSAGFLDAANVDLKGATEEHYRTVCGAALEPVLRTIRSLHQAGVWVEVTTLLIPGYNDDEASLDFMAGFIASVDTRIPWHLSRFFPTYKLMDAPPTPVESLQRAARQGREAGLEHIYIGNVAGEGHRTRCTGCGQTLIERSGFDVTSMNVTPRGLCSSCGAPFDGVIASGKGKRRDTEPR